MPVQAIHTLIPTIPGGQGATPVPSQAQPGRLGFRQLLADQLQALNREQVQADQQVEALLLGDSSNVQQVVLSLAKAELGFRFLMELRNQLIETYQELMRMQV